jgi:hypothetical protein
MIFIQNKYTRIYYTIIQQAQIRVKPETYTENHHIIPKSLGGDNSKDNLVALTAREHFVCHLLLTKMTEGDARSKMAMAVFYLTGRGKAKERNNVIKSSRLYQKLKEDFAIYNSKQHKGCKQPPRTTETRQRLTESKTGKLNPNYKCDWVTPWGTFNSSRLAAKACPDYITANSIINFCQKKNTKPISYLSICRSKGWLNEEHIGKTPFEVGFSINTTC